MSQRFDPHSMANSNRFPALSGNGPPAAALGVDGQIYRDLIAGAEYGPKRGGAWGAARSLASDTGPAENIYPDKTSLAASDPTRRVASLKATPTEIGTRYCWRLGNFTGRTDVIVSTVDGGTPITQGAWVPQDAGEAITTKAPGLIRSQQSQKRDGWSPLDWFVSENKRQLVREFSDSAAAECTFEVNRALGSGEYIKMPAGKLLTEGALIGRAGLKFVGSGAGKSIIKKPNGSTEHLMDIIGTTIKRNILISGFEMDINGCDAGIVMEYVEDSLFENLKIVNHPYWGILLGVQNGDDHTVRNRRNNFKNLYFSNTSLTYEHLLIFNSEDTEVDGFYGDRGRDANGIGLYQNVERFSLRNFLIQDMKVALYYSLSCRNIYISNGIVRNTVAGIQGANLADNGNFGAKYAEDLRVHNVKFFGNKDNGISLGALYRFHIDRCEFDGNLEAGITFTRGGIGVAGTPALERIANSGIISNSTFRNNNVSNISSINAPGIKFAAASGEMEVELVDNQFVDDRGIGNEKQLYPVTFVDGAYTKVRMRGGSAKSYEGATTIGTTNATVDLEMTDVRDITADQPIGVTGLRLVATLSYDPPNLTAGARSNPVDVSVPGARKGDACLVTFDKIQGGVIVDCLIVGDGVAQVNLTNRSGRTIDMAAGTLTVIATRTRRSM